MAITRFYNIVGSTLATVQLIEPKTSGQLKSITFTNVHATADATVTLFIQDDPISGATSTFNIIHTIAVPADSTLLLDNSSMLSFPEKFGLYITVGSSDTIDVMLNK